MQYLQHLLHQNLLIKRYKLVPSLGLQQEVDNN